MAVYAIGDLHLSLSTNKTMEKFGAAWRNYIPRIADSLSRLREWDVLVLVGDTSWGRTLEEAEEDFRFLDQFPVKKYLVKGNHDYWWTTAAKFYRFCQEKNIKTLSLLHNNCYFYGRYALCGTRGWFWEEERKKQQYKVVKRELGRLESSLRAAGTHPIFCFLHYPPFCLGYIAMKELQILEDYHVLACYYGHLHGKSVSRRFEGSWNDLEFRLISADHLGFVPKKICET